MLTQEANDRYSRVGPGTPTGELMRRYWHPIAAVSQMNDKSTKKVRLLGEDLILYKDKSGTFGLMEPHCAHRRMNMIYGIPEENGLRCPYHGWLYNETGQCIEQPYEETEDPDARFKDKIQMKAYPVEQKAGLLFAYMGPQPAPLVPNWDVFAADGVLRDLGYAELPCNWLQCQENSLDPVHLEWLHVAWANYIREQNDELNEVKTVRAHKTIQFDNFKHGIIKRRIWEGGSEEDTEWKDGHPIVFPYMLRQGGDGFNLEGSKRWTFKLGPAFQIRVPIDDYTTGHWWVACYPMIEGDLAQKPEEIPYYNPPVPMLDENDQPVFPILRSNSGQDVAAWITQGNIADRTGEHLGRSDKGIIQFRQMLEENIRLVEEGKDPMNTFRNPEENKYIAFMTEQALYANTSVRQGAATMYSPILDAREAAGTLHTA
jgi:5,5'-dehydrodivanillate O-demethylase